MKMKACAGALDDDEFALAAKVFDRVLAEQRIPRESDDAEDVALRIVHFAQMGLDADALYAAATGRLEDAIRCSPRNAKPPRKVA